MHAYTYPSTVAACARARESGNREVHPAARMTLEATPLPPPSHSLSHSLKPSISIHRLALTNASLARSYKGLSLRARLLLLHCSLRVPVYVSSFWFPRCRATDGTYLSLL